MKIYILSISLLLMGYISFAQKVNFPTMGEFSEFEKNLTIYPKDTTAHSIVLNEIGYSSVRNGGDYDIIKKVFRRIKILDKQGIDETTFKIRLHNDERLISLKAQTANINNNGIVITNLEKSHLYKTKETNNRILYSFTFPNVKVGSIIEYTYKISTPYHYNFAGGWIFQNSIPTIKSTFYARIPGFWKYNITSIGLKNIQFQQNTLIKDCISVNSTVAECFFFELTLKDLPAFKEEDYSTSYNNFLQQINFELESFTDERGVVKHYNKTWKYTDKRLFTLQQFGKEYNKIKFIKKQLPQNIFNETNNLSKAKKIYSFIQDHYKWDEEYKLFSEFNIKKAFDSRVANMVEINLNLIQALNAANIPTDIALLSTRNNGFVNKVNPGISSFNYLVAHTNINGTDYFLDATEKMLPFGVLPLRCLNNDIRVFNKINGSYWSLYKPENNNITSTYTIGSISEDGTIAMKSRFVYSNYAAYIKRNKIKHSTLSTYKEEIADDLNEFDIINHTISNLNTIDEKLIEIIELEYDTDFFEDGKIYLKPFVIKDFKSNPFKLKERLYPVDLGYKRQFIYNITFNLPEGYKVSSTPKNRKLILNNNGGELLYVINSNKDKINIRFSFSLNKTRYSPKEYDGLKEYIAQLIMIQNELIILEKE